MTHPAAILLAAGRSSRMGAFKPLLPVGDQSMIQRLVQTMRRSGADPILVVTGHRHAELEAHLSDYGLVFIHNPQYAQTHMLDSILLGLSRLPDNCERVLLSPSDLPLVRPETVTALLRSPGVFVRPCYQGRGGHPVLLSRTLLPVLNQYQGPDGLAGALRFAGIRPTDIPVSDPGIHLSCNTPEEYTALLRHFHEQEDH